jgi:membrane protein insertase, YidC/Oxa1 family, N-terminal domain
MDNKNVFIAIALSMSVLLFWAAFFETPKPVNNDAVQQQQKTNENIIAPNINESLKVETISRENSIKNTERIKIENDSIVGSMSLEGGLIDDISFKKHKQNLENNLNVEFLNPAQTEDGFYVETGWTSIGSKIKVPSKKSIWKVNGNKILSDKEPVILEWDNNEGIG